MPNTVRRLTLLLLLLVFSREVCENVMSEQRFNQKGNKVTIEIERTDLEKSQQKKAVFDLQPEERESESESEICHEQRSVGMFAVHPPGEQMSSPSEGESPSSSSARGTLSDYSQQDSQSNVSANSMDSGSPRSSHLHPILTRDARTRSYLVGSLGSQDTLLGGDEVRRYFPEGKVNIIALSWNMSSKEAPSELNDLLLPEALVYVPDIYAIGVQESAGGSSQDIKEWEVQMQTTIGPNHVLLHKVALGVLHLAIFVRRDLIWFFSVPEDASYNSRSSPANMVKTKGAVGVSFLLFGTSFLFINSHLPAHEWKNKERIEEYEKIIYSLDLPKNKKALKPRYVSRDVTGRFDCVIWLGDLNFRIERGFKETISLLAQISLSAMPSSFEGLLKQDQLLQALDRRTAFAGFFEASTITFPPTFKYIIGKDTFEKTNQRVPSYTDRILYRTKRPGHVNCICYNSVPQVKTSDHRPVFALLEVQLRPGWDAMPLNAGNFNREVYVESLKRRKANHEAGEDRRGSLVCTIS